MSNYGEDNANATYAVIPVGFYYVTGTPSEGLVVSDVNGDDDSNSKGGNQFVWVPCNGEGGVTYEKENGLATTWTKKYSDYQYFYTTVPDYTDSSTGEVTKGWTLTDCWSDDGGDATSVATYGGFYIGRYEAGISENAAFYANTNGATYSTNRDVTTYTDSDGETQNLTPVSKKGVQAWNFISQANSKIVSENMYTDTDKYAVTSSLVDSYAWDTIEEWMNNTISGIATDSTNYGNYINNASIKVTNTLHAYYLNRTIATGSTVTTGAESVYPSTYLKGTVTSGSKTITTAKELLACGFSESSYSSYGFEDYTYSVRVELATGANDSTSINNIYDMAGNMWEWTTETGEHVTSVLTATTGTYAVRRGSCFDYSGLSYPLSYRDGRSTTTITYFTIGFRVVLYIT